MKDWRKTLTSPQASIHQTIQIIDSSGLQIALVVDENQTLLGVVTDGDIRRAILKALPLSTPISEVMNTHPLTIQQRTSVETILSIMKKNSLQRIPIINSQKQVVNLALLETLIQPEVKQNRIVLMAGGLGTRLKPLTEHFPKPLLKVGSKPVLQTIIENFREQGFIHFYLSVNYKAEMIEAYFKDGSQFDVSIQYLQEKQRLGTAGALSLLPEMPNEPLIVMNGDLLTKVDYRQLLNFHKEHEAAATMCVREYDFQVPYGVVEIEQQRITGIKEKPVQRFFVNAGIYVLNPETLNQIPHDQFFDMPSLFESLIAQQKNTVVFPIHEYWIDIGQMADYEKANNEFAQNFAN